MKDSHKSKSLLSAKDRIEIILHEYDTLRDEVVENISRQQTFLTIWLTLLLAFLGFASQYPNHSLIAFFPFGILTLLSIEANRQYSLTVMCTYIKVLEKQINELAGEPLLMWELTGTSFYLDKLKLELPTSKKPIFNSHLFIGPIYFIVAIIIFIVSLYLGGRYVYASVNPPLKVVTGISYVLLHTIVLIFIIFSRLFQEKKIFAGYEKKILKIKRLASTSSPYLNNKSVWR